MDESNCKSSFAPPSVIWNGAMEQIYQGKTISTMGMIDFWPDKKFERFFVRQGFPPFSESPISI
jgi:hypothetical protein